MNIDFTAGWIGGLLAMIIIIDVDNILVALAIALLINVVFRVIASAVKDL